MVPPGPGTRRSPARPGPPLPPNPRPPPSGSARALSWPVAVTAEQGEELEPEALIPGRVAVSFKELLVLRFSCVDTGRVCQPGPAR